jgi:hypothetical protein
VADLLEAAFLEINGAPATALADLRERINFGDRGNMSADDLALAQLRRLDTGEKAPGETALLASLTASEGADVEDEGSTEEGDDDGVAVAEGEDPGDVQAEGDDDAAADLAPVAAVARTVPGSVADLLSAAPAAAIAAFTPAPAAPAPAVDPAAQPIAAATPPAPVVATPVDPAAVAPAPVSAPSPLQQ